jgi:hypothetical protein
VRSGNSITTAARDSFQKCQPQRVAVVDERVPVSADASVPDQTKWPLQIATGARLDIDPGRPGFEDEQRTIICRRVLFFSSGMTSSLPL